MQDWRVVMNRKWHHPSLLVPEMIQQKTHLIVVPPVVEAINKKEKDEN